MLEGRVVLGRLKSIQQLPGANQILAELIQGGGLTLHSEIHNLMLMWNKELTMVIIKGYHSCQLHTKFYPTFFSLG
jgi:hypothetical protein